MIVWLPQIPNAISASVAALIDSGKDGAWALKLLAGGPLAAPHPMHAEAANILRQAILSGQISADAGALAHADLLALRIRLFPYSPFAARVWKLRGNLTAYDAWYVAIAEELGAKLATLDARLARAHGPRCGFKIPPEASAG
jgi:predicted nucleic acid-binding protein